MAYKVNIRGGSHPRLEDYECSTCGFLQEDVYFSSRDKVTPTRPCTECDATADKLIAHRRTNFIHPSHSGLYGKYEPALGCVVEDYGHKQRLMKELNVEEASDATGGSKSYWQPEPGPRPQTDSNWIDDPGSH